MMYLPRAYKRHMRNAAEGCRMLVTKWQRVQHHSVLARLLYHAGIGDIIATRLRAKNHNAKQQQRNNRNEGQQEHNLRTYAKSMVTVSCAQDEGDEYLS
jgi:hypothetical protein